MSYELFKISQVDPAHFRKKKPYGWVVVYTKLSELKKIQI